MKVAALDLEHIFIHREDQIRIIDTAVQAWKRQAVGPAYQGHSINGQHPCIVCLSGGGGLGKSTLLNHYREGLVTSEPLLHVGKVIDWWYVLNDESRLRHFMVDKVYEMQYIEMIYQQLSWSLERRLYEFKEYKRNLDMIMNLEGEVSQIVKNAQKIAECNALWKIPKVRRLKLLQWFVHSGLYEQDVEKVTRILMEYTGVGVDIELACINYLCEELSKEMGGRFSSYLRTGDILGTALGHDLQGFAKDRPLVIFFDTYECVERGSDLLMSIIEAAGTQVGWFIAGRSQAWTSVGLSGFTKNSVCLPCSPNRCSGSKELPQNFLKRMPLFY
jgi:hypothetical protein